MKTVNLDDKKNAVEITIAGETFVISRVVLAVHDLYNEYLEALTDYDGEGLTVVQRVRKFVDLRKQFILPIMTLLMTKNGYEYNDAWWRENVESYDIMDQFIRECITKDVEEPKKKEVTEESLTDTG